MSELLDRLKARGATQTTPLPAPAPTAPPTSPLKEAMTPEPEMGKLGAGAYGLGNALTFGQLDAVLPWLSQNLDAVVPGSPYTKEDVQKGLAKAEKDQPWTYAGGRMAGDIARTAPLMLIPGVGPLAAFGAASAVGGSAAEHGINYARGKEDATQAIKGGVIDTASALAGKGASKVLRTIPGVRGLDTIAREAPGTPAGTIARTAAQPVRPFLDPILRAGRDAGLGGGAAAMGLHGAGVPFATELSALATGASAIPQLKRAVSNVGANINRGAAKEATQLPASLLNFNPFGGASSTAVDATKFAGDLLRTTLPSVAQELIPPEYHRYSEQAAEQRRRQERLERKR